MELYGLAESQMREVYNACRLKNWKQYIESIAFTWDECEDLNDEDFKNIAEDALHVWDNHCDTRGEIESQIAEDAIADYLAKRNKEE